jgi:hypothetical protein
MTEVRLEDHSFWLVPGRFHLLLAEGCQEMESAFRDLFDQAWLNRVPSVGRAGILSGWRSPGPVFVHLQSGQFFASGKGLEPAYYLHDARKFFFAADALFSFPSGDWPVLVVAHELAHAYLFSVCSTAHAPVLPQEPIERERVSNEREAEVHALLAQWGLDVSLHEAIRAWGEDNGWGNK